MVRIPVAFERPVETTQIASLGPEQFRVNGDFDGAINTFVDIDGFGTGGFSYRILAIRIMTSGGAASEIAEVILRYPSSPWPQDVVYRSRCVLSNAATDTTWASGEPGPPATGPVAGTDYYQYNLPDFWFTNAVTLRLAWSIGRAGFWSVLYEKVSNR
jgi:hypothetical protein